MFLSVLRLAALFRPALVPPCSRTCPCERSSGCLHLPSADLRRLSVGVGSLIYRLFHTSSPFTTSHFTFCGLSTVQLPHPVSCFPLPLPTRCLLLAIVGGFGGSRSRLFVFGAAAVSAGPSLTSHITAVLRYPHGLLNASALFYSVRANSEPQWCLAWQPSPLPTLHTHWGPFHHLGTSICFPAFDKLRLAIWSLAPICELKQARCR